MEKMRRSAFERGTQIASPGADVTDCRTSSRLAGHSRGTASNAVRRSWLVDDDFTVTSRSLTGEVRQSAADATRRNHAVP
jgi:hypothetical protein